MNSQASIQKGLEKASNATEQSAWEVRGSVEGQSRGDRKI